MLIVALSDIHGRGNMSRDVVKAISGADLVIIAGDITNFGGKEDAEKIIRDMKSLNEKILAIPGNCDQHDVTGFLESEGISLHGKTREINGTLFLGVGGSGGTPFRTPQEYSDDDFVTLLKTFHKRDNIKHYVLVSHDPPVRTKVDRTALGRHAGNIKIREFIETFQPDLCICGHIHEARGEDLIGKTRIINPGPFSKYYALVEINRGISLQLLES